MDAKTSMHLQPSKSRKHSLTCAVTGCTNNEYNLELWRDSLCKIHHLPRKDGQFNVVARNLTGEFLISFFFRCKAVKITTGK